MNKKNPWRNRIVGYGEEQIDQVLYNPRNWRIHPKDQQDALAGVLSEIGVVQNVIVNRRTGNLVDGHLRVLLADRNGEKSIPATYIDLSEEEECLVLATLDPLAALAAADKEKLDKLLRETSTGDAALQKMLADLAESHGLHYGQETPVQDAEPQVDRADELRKEWGIELGQLWKLGEHRLLCGDSTKVDDVDKLMKTEKAVLLITSPPYNQHIDQFHPSGMHKEQNWVAKVARLAYADSMPENEYQDQQQKALKVWFDVMTDGASVFYNHKNRYRDKHMISPLQWLPGPFQIRQEIVWSRPGSVTQNARMFLPYDERIYWLYRGNDFKFHDSTEIKTWSTIWEIRLEPNLNHAVGFPIELPRRCILACSDPNSIVMEPYCGSGTTLIACEQLGRHCRAIEIDPGYCAVTLQRWSDVTGKRPELIS